MDVIRLSLHLFLLLGAVNTGALISEDAALLFDCGDSVTYERLASLGAGRVDKILFTQHRRVNTAGAYAYTDGNFGDRKPELIVPASERGLFENTDDYWSEWKKPLA